MMKRSFLISIIFLTALSSYSQSGYRGKTIYLGYTNGSSPLFFLPSYNGEANAPSYSMSHELSINKVCTRKHEISFFFIHHRSSFVPSYIEDFKGVSPYKIKNLTYGLNLRLYINRGKKWGVAPIGSYMDLKPYVSTIALDYVSNTESAKLYKLITPGLSFGLGRQKVLFDRMTFNYGVQCSLPFNIVPVIINFVDGVFLYGDDEQAEFIDSAIKRDFLKTTFQIKIGIGFLAF